MQTTMLLPFLLFFFLKEKSQPNLNKKSAEFCKYYSTAAGRIPPNRAKLESEMLTSVVSLTPKQTGTHRHP